MLYTYISVGLVIGFFVFILYVSLVKKNIRNHKNNILVFLGFLAIWAMLYFILL